MQDSTGALIPGVEITATNNGTGIVSNTVTNEAGAYNFPSLQTGTYSLRAELPGFQTQQFTNVALGISQQVRLNFRLEVGSVSQQVEVSIAADTLLATSSASVGSVLPEYKVRDLPTVRGNVLDLISTSAGTVELDSGRVGNFAGARVSAVAVTRDGVNVQDGRYEFGAFSAVFQSPDMVEEVRVIVAPSDAEVGRGSGQVQLSTRSGTNQFHGSAYWTNSNSVLNANTWSRNFNNSPKDYFNRNEYGARLGGPIIRNKSFFFAFFTGQRVAIRETFLGNVLTEQARRGTFRYFPGADNNNANSAAPTVDRNGNPVRPAAATGDLRSFNVFAADPLRTGISSHAWIQESLARMPLPNDFTGGDGLNTARIRFVRKIPGRDIGVGEGVEVNRDQYNLRLDHNFNQTHKLSIIATREKDWSFGQPVPRPWPTGFDGTTVKRPDVYTVKLVSTLSSTVVNEFTGARKRSMNWAYSAANRNDDHGREALKYIPSANGINFRLSPSTFSVFNGYGGFGSWREGINPQWTIGDSLSWTMGKHAFKAGGEYRNTSSNGFNDPDVTPIVVFGAGSQAVTGIDATAFQGLTSTNQTLARNILLDLNGSVGTIRQSFVMKDSKELKFFTSPEVPNNRQILYQNEFSAFFKDDWKLRPDLTLNLGAHWEYYGPPWEKRGLAGAVTSLDQLKCGYACGLTTVELVGRNSPNPDKNTYYGRIDWNNLGPNVGLSWNIPWLDNTVLRVGYGVVYEGALRNFIGVGGVLRTPGMFIGNSGSGASYTPANYTGLTQVQLPIPKAIETPLLPMALNDKSQTIAVYDHISPYTQNFNFEIQRELMENLTLEARYVGTKGTKLWGVINLNTEDIFNNGILQAFNVTRAGGDADLFNRMLMGINIGGGASTVNGTTMTGSQALRLNSTTRTQLANGNVGALANYLNTNTAGTGQPGGLIRRNGFPENFINANPQFNSVNLETNPANSTYHSVQLQLTKRLSNGFTNSTTYTWSKALGESDGSGGATSRDPRNRSINKRLLGFDRRHALTSNGTLELPFGPNKALLNGAPGWVSRIVEKWQLGGIFTLTSGAPLTITAERSTIYNSTTDTTPVIVGNFSNKGKVVPLDVGATYFEGYRVVDDPYKSSVTSVGNVVGSFSNRAIVDASGNLVFVNPQPGTLGNYGLTTIIGPGRWSLDLNLIKRITITEGKEFEFRLTAENALNHANWNNPETSINSLDFGRITGASGNRLVTTSLRLNF